MNLESTYLDVICIVEIYKVDDQNGILLGFEHP